MKYLQLLTFIFLVNHQIFGQEVFEMSVSSNCLLRVVKNDSLKTIDIFNNSNDIIKNLSTGETAYFENPIFFKFDNSTFLRIQEVVYGTAYASMEYVYHVNKDCRLDSIEFLSAAEQYFKTLGKDETILKGEYRTFKDNEITFSFGIWKKGDPSCCPSKGYMHGKYKLIKSEDNKKVKYQMAVSEQKLILDY